MMNTQIQDDSARNISEQLNTGMCAVSQMVPSPLNPRKVFDEDGIRELAASIKEHGMLEPIVVRTNPALDTSPDAAKFEIIAGERRWRAANIAGIEMVPIRVLDNIDDRKALELALIENLARRDINPIEEAQGYKALADMGYKQSEIAEKINRSQPVIANALRVLELPEDVKGHIQSGKLSMSHGRALVPFAEHEEVLNALVDAALDGALTKDIETFNVEKLLSYEARHSLPMKCLAAYGTRFDSATCKGCNNKKHNYCLDTACYDQKTIDAIEARESEMKAAIERGETDFDKWENSAWRRLDIDNPLPGCDISCEHYTVGIYYKNIVHACINPNCHKELQNKLDDAIKAQRDEKFFNLMDRVFSEAMLPNGEINDAAYSKIAAIAVENTLGACLTHQISDIAHTLEMNGLDSAMVSKYIFVEKERLTRITHLANYPAHKIILLALLSKLATEAETSVGRNQTPQKIEWFAGKPLMEVFFEDSGESE